MQRIMEAKKRKIEEAEVFLLPSQKIKLKKQKEREFRKLQEKQDNTQLLSDQDMEPFYEMLNKYAKVESLNQDF
jgi:hypothetical protein